MTSLTPLDTCLARALDGLAAVPAVMLAPADARGFVLARDVLLPHDLPPVAEALRAGYAVAALDLTGASAGMPVPLGRPVRIAPPAPLPAGTDAILPEDGTESAGGLIDAIRPVAPGEGVRFAGHDGRAGDPLIRAGTQLAARHILAARHAGIAELPVRRPRVAVELDDPVQAAFLRDGLTALGAVLAEGEAELTLRPATDDSPRLALAPGDTAWLDRVGPGLVLQVPPRFDAMLAALLALALPALAALTGARPRALTRPLARKLASAVGLSELVLLADDGAHWVPQPAGTVTLNRLASARAFAILPPDSEGVPAGAPLAATPLDHPFG